MTSADRRRGPDATRGPLAGVRVIDTTTVFAGPFATQYLADLGADVIKVEPPSGDVTRQIGPGHHLGLGSAFIALNRNKRSVGLDLKNPDGREALLRITATADVFISSVRPAATTSLGIDYDSLRARNPALVYAQIVGFAQDGPNAEFAAYDDVIQAASGMAHLLGRDEAPRYVPLAIADRTVGAVAFGVIAAALFDRERTGRGQRLEIPMLETMASLVLADHLYGATFVPAQGGMKYPRLVSAARRPYPTADGYLCCVVYTDAHWRSFLDLIGKPELAESDPRFADLASRTRHIDELYGLIATHLVTRSTAEWIEILRPRDIPCFPVATLDSLLEGDQLSPRLLQRSLHPEVGEIREVRHPVVWEERVLPESAAPTYAQHTREVLREAGYSAAGIDALQASGAAPAHSSQRSTP